MFSKEMTKYVYPISSSDLNKFPLYFSNILSMCGMSQLILAKRAQEELFNLIADQLISAEDAGQVTTAQALVSAAKRGERRPAYNLLVLWVRVLWKWHRSEQLYNICEEIGVPVPIFEIPHVKTLYALAGYAMGAQEVHEASVFADWYNEQVKLVQTSPFAHLYREPPKRTSSHKIVSPSHQHETGPIDISGFKKFVETQKSTIQK